MGGVDFDESFLEDDWDPTSHDKMMADRYNDEYYAAAGKVVPYDPHM